MLLTALAVVVGASAILADPIFQGLAISLMAGEIASLLISRMAVPVLYYMVSARAQGGHLGKVVKGGREGGGDVGHFEEGMSLGRAPYRHKEPGSVFCARDTAP